MSTPIPAGSLAQCPLVSSRGNRQHRVPSQSDRGRMKRFANLKRLGFFTRLLDEAPPADRYRFAAEQIVRAEKAGLDSAWIAQHHFHEREGGLPSPFPFLGYVAARASRIRLGAGIVTLPLVCAVRVAVVAAVFVLFCVGR